MLLLGGTVVLFRVALAIIQISSAELLACDSAATLYAGIKSLTGHLYQVDRLLDVCLSSPPSDLSASPVPHQVELGRADEKHRSHLTL